MFFIIALKTYLIMIPHEKKTYLVTGGNGNLARQLTDKLAVKGHRLVLLDNQPTETAHTAPGITYVQGDIANRDHLKEIFQTYQPTYVLHMASLLSGSSEIDRSVAWEVNARASFDLLELSLEHKIQCFFYPSTVVTYGTDLPDPLPEDHPQWPGSIYGATKVAVERTGHYYFSKHGLDFRSVRLPFVISKYAPKGAMTAYASHVFSSAVEGRPFVFPVKEETTVSTIYVKDVVDGVLQLLEAPGEKLKRRVYNLHSFSPSALDLATAIKKRIPGFSWSFSPDPAALAITSGMPVSMLDISARTDWGWDPKFQLEEMVDNFIKELSS